MTRANAGPPAGARRPGQLQPQVPFSSMPSMRMPYAVFDGAHPFN